MPTKPKSGNGPNARVLLRSILTYDPDMDFWADETTNLGEWGALLARAKTVKVEERERESLVLKVARTLCADERGAGLFALPLHKFLAKLNLYGSSTTNKKEEKELVDFLREVSRDISKKGVSQDEILNKVYPEREEDQSDIVRKTKSLLSHIGLNANVWVSMIRSELLTSFAPSGGRLGFATLDALGTESPETQVASLSISQLQRLWALEKALDLDNGDLSTEQKE